MPHALRAGVGVATRRGREAARRVRALAATPTGAATYYLPRYPAQSLARAGAALVGVVPFMDGWEGYAFARTADIFSPLYLHLLIAVRGTVCLQHSGAEERIATCLARHHAFCVTGWRIKPPFTWRLSSGAVACAAVTCASFAFALGIVARVRFCVCRLHTWRDATFFARACLPACSAVPYALRERIMSGARYSARVTLPGALGRTQLCARPVLTGAAATYLHHRAAHPVPHTTYLNYAATTGTFYCITRARALYNVSMLRRHCCSVTDCSLLQRICRAGDAIVTTRAHSARVLRANIMADSALLTTAPSCLCGAGQRRQRLIFTHSSPIMLAAF